MVYNNNYLPAIVQDNPGEPALELTETLSQYTTLIVLKFLTSTANLSSQAS